MTSTCSYTNASIIRAWILGEASYMIVLGPSSSAPAKALRVEQFD